MREVNLDGIEEKYNQVKAFMGTLGQINRDFNTEQGITEGYLGPFNKGFELHQLTAKIREDLIGFLVRKLNRELCPNVTINSTAIEKELTEKFGELGFNADFVYYYIQASFVTRSEVLSREEILDHARKLLPVLWSFAAQREVQLEDIQQGRKLSLRLYMDSYYSDKYQYLTAIEKLAKIVLDHQDPTTVNADELSTVYWHKEGDELYRTYELQDANIEKVRAHKNGKFLIYFRDEEKAQKVAKALLREEQNK